MEFIVKNFQFLVIVALFLVITLQRCGEKPTPQQPIIVQTIDTNWVKKMQPIVYVESPAISNYIPAAKNPKRDTAWLPSPNNDTLRMQYKALRDSLLNTKIYDQTLKYDSSSVRITDTVTENKLAGRSYQFNLKYPVITNTTTITIPPKPVNQLYIGGSLLGNPSNLLGGAKLNLIYKNKKDQIYNGGVLQQFNGQTFYEFGTAFKINLRKR
jgi:hypothetical protein